MTEVTAGLSSRPTTRSSGLFGLILAAGGAVALAVRTTLALRAEEAGVASNILASEPVLRMGFVANLIGAALFGLLQLVAYHALAALKFGIAVLQDYFRLLRSLIEATDVPVLIHLAPLMLKLAEHDVAAIVHAFFRHLS